MWPTCNAEVTFAEQMKFERAETWCDRPTGSAGHLPCGRAASARPRFGRAGPSRIL